MKLTGVGMKVVEYRNQSDIAIIILHEIYGVNNHIDSICKEYFSKGYDVYCPDLLNLDRPFDYSQSLEAYRYFMEKIGFFVHHQVNILIEQLKRNYRKVLLLGFSIGASIAYICSENAQCDAVIAYYGSRIRDYITVIPKCQALLIFAKEDSFDVTFVAEKLKRYKNVTLEVLEGKHGFMDHYSINYQNESCRFAQDITDKFIRLCVTEN